jgi:small subunit ribosomal protein S16
MKKMGSKKKPFFRFVATDTRSPRDGRFIEILGYYNPMVDPPEIKFDEDKVYKWLNVGAEPSGNVAQLLKKAGLLERWQLLKQGVKISELDAKIAERREKQPKPKTREEREATKKKDEKAEGEQAVEQTKEEDTQEKKVEEEKTATPETEPGSTPGDEKPPAEEKEEKKEKEKEKE